MSKLNTPEILEEMAKTYRERNAIYGDNWQTHTAALRAIFPAGVVLKDEFETTMYSWFSIMLGKMTRLANAGFQHQDSIHDIAVYAAMMEAYLALQGQPKPAPEYVLCYKGTPEAWHVKPEDLHACGL
jgi:hypothetical protein